MKMNHELTAKWHEPDKVRVGLKDAVVLRPVFRAADGYIQYSTDGGSTWTNLIAVADLKGADGAQGAKGDTGATGPQGPKGDTGEKGDPGATGPVGPAGVPGKDGANGETGPAGPRGPAGAPGKDGADGKPGTTGADGVTPHIGDNGHWYIGSTDTGKPSRGVAGAKGKDGAQGEKGADGKTPVRGTDYWTAADKQEIVSSVIAALPDGTEVSY